MSMSSNVYGIVEPNGKFIAMKAVYDACRTAGVTIPDEVDDYFEGEAPCDSGMVIQIPYTKGNFDCGEYFEVDISQLDRKIKKIRFENSY